MSARPVNPGRSLCLEIRNAVTAAKPLTREGVRSADGRGRDGLVSRVGCPPGRTSATVHPEAFSASYWFPWRPSSRGNAASVGRRPRRLGRGRVFRTGRSARERCLWPTASPSGVADTPASSAPGFAPTRGPRPGPGARRGAGVAAGAAPAPADAARGSCQATPPLAPRAHASVSPTALGRPRR